MKKKIKVAILALWRGGQAVRQESAKLLYAGAIPAHASNLASVLELVYRADLKSAGLRPCGFESHPRHTKKTRSLLSVLFLISPISQCMPLLFQSPLLPVW